MCGNGSVTLDTDMDDSSLPISTRAPSKSAHAKVCRRVIVCGRAGQINIGRARRGLSGSNCTRKFVGSEAHRRIDDGSCPGSATRSAVEEGEARSPSIISVAGGQAMARSSQPGASGASISIGCPTREGI